MKNLDKFASLYLAEGFFVLPISRAKVPIIDGWTKKRLSETEIFDFIQNKNAQLGIVTGKVSGITVIDIDLINPGVFGTDPAIFPDTYTVRTPSGGLQKYYQYDSRIHQGQNAFAKYPKVDIRNDGGYVAAVPSSMDYIKKYKDSEVRVQGSYTIESGSILSLAPFPVQMFTEYLQEKSVPFIVPVKNKNRPGDVFNASTVTWDSLLNPLGFTRVSNTDKKSTHWTRPGKTDGSTGATTKLCEDGQERLFVFSTNAQPFEAWSEARHNSYTKFQAFALLYHQGDFSAAARDVKRQGFEYSPPAMADKKKKELEEMEVTCLDDIEEKAIDWLWQGKIARGELCIIAGEPGAGKTLISADIAARISKGSTVPFSSICMCEGSVIFLTSENDPAKVLRPRLVAAGADLKKIHILSSSINTKDENGKKKIERHVALSEDAEKIGRAIRKNPDIVALIIDPISEYMGKKDANSNSDVRDVLATLTDYVREMNVAIIAITHYNKKVEINSASARINGSIGFAGAARTAFAVGKFYDDEWSDEEKEARKGQMAFSSVKNNLSADKSGYVYKIGSFIYEKNGDTIDTAKLEWIEEITESADDLLRRANEKRGRPPKERNECVKWLTDFLTGNPAGVSRADVILAGARKGFSSSTIDRAKKDMVIISDSKTGVWTLFTGEF